MKKSALANRIVTTVTTAPTGPVPRRYPLPLGEKSGCTVYTDIQNLQRHWDKDLTGSFMPRATGVDKDGPFVVLEYFGRGHIALYLKPEDIDHKLFQYLSLEEREQLVQHCQPSRLLQPEEWRARWPEFSTANELISLERVEDGLVVGVSFDGGMVAKLAVKDAYDATDKVFRAAKYTEISSEVCNAFGVREVLPDGRYKLRDPIFWFRSSTYSKSGKHESSSYFDVSPHGLGDHADEGLRVLKTYGKERVRRGGYFEWLIASTIREACAVPRWDHPISSHASDFVDCAASMVNSSLQSGPVTFRTFEWLEEKMNVARVKAEEAAESNRREKEDFVQRMKEARAKKAEERAAASTPKLEPQVRMAKRRNGKAVFATGKREVAV